jgi:NADH dehydrogenase/NADH:ubiquinone oxidoreductase subunit G
MIDVCPVGALTDKTFRFKSRVWFLKPMDATCGCTKCSGKAVVWMFGNEIYRVTARKDKYGEVEDQKMGNQLGFAMIVVLTKKKLLNGWLKVHAK